MKTNFRNGLSDKTILVIGIAFIVIGAGLWVYVGLNILTREQTSYDPNLSLEERWRIEGSLRWWRDVGARLYPLAAVLLVGGLVAIAVSVRLLQETEKKQRFNEGVEPCNRQF